MKVAVLLTCHNRCGTTLECLRHLFACQLPRDLEFDVWLNDDGCEDGTADAVLQSYPQVNVVRGSGADYWCGGMRRVWRSAAASGVPYAGYLWLNDDTMLYPTALMTLFASDSCGRIIVGATKDSKSDRMTYGGRDEKGCLLPLEGKERRVFRFNGNCVFVPSDVFQRLGTFPEYLTHALGDFDYARRACEKGIVIIQAMNFVGECNDHQVPKPWMKPSCPLVKRMTNLYSPVGGPEPNVFFKYNLCHYGVIRAVRVWIQQHMRMLMPWLWEVMK